MKPILAAILFTLASVCSGDTLRISELAEAAGDGVERMVLKTKDGEETLFVKTKVVLGDADVKEASPDLFLEGHINVKLNEDGGKKFKEVTAKARHGRDRLAIIIEGRLIAAPVIQATLGSSFIISGLQDMELRELDDLSRKMSGRPPRPEGEDPDPPKPFPKFETVPFTEKEYQINKAKREKMGIFYVESIPTKEELNQLLRKGMEREDVLKLFGKPYMASEKPHDDDFYFIYSLALEKRAENPKREMRPDGFKVNFSDGKLSWWSLNYSNGPRKEKIVGIEEPTLKAILPEVDLSSEDLDPIAYVEGIVIPDPKQSVNKRDLGELLSIVTMLSSALDEDREKTTLDADCDFLKTLSHHFPEVDALRKSAKEGRVSVDKLNEVLFPYALGEEELPVKAKRADAEQPSTRSESDSEDGDKSQPDPSR